MKTLILSLGVVAALSGSVLAQSAYDDRAASADINSVTPDTMTDGQVVDIDRTTTGSISSATSQDERTAIRRGNQGPVFGANGN